MNWTRTWFVGLTIVLCVVVAVGIWRFETKEHDILRRMATLSQETSHLDRHDSGEAFAPLPQNQNVDTAKVELGRRLFHDRRLSANLERSCASCHDVRSGGDDGLTRSTGATGSPEDFNTSSVINSRYNLLRFWDGRPANLTKRGDSHDHGPRQLGSSYARAADRLASDPELASAFAEAFSQGLSGQTIGQALDWYIDSLTTPETRFDRFLRGDRTALSLTERQGFRLFNSIGCAACHQGRNLGGNMVQRIGVYEDYFALRGGPISEADLGRFNRSEREEDRHVFRVPSLRNVTKTAPYFHDGSIGSLDRAVHVMARVQLGRRLKAEEAAKLVAFLGTLEGRVAEPSP